MGTWKVVRDYNIFKDELISEAPIQQETSRWTRQKLTLILSCDQREPGIDEYEHD